MDDVVQIKQTVQEMELTQNWMAICEYVQTEWEKHQDSPELCTLLMQQAMSYLLATDNGSSPFLFVHRNNCPESIAYYQNCFVAAMKHGMDHHLHHKYFLWQLCYYIIYYPTYYPIFKVIGGETKLNDIMQELMSLVNREFSNSLIFRPFLAEKDYYAWIHSLSDADLFALHSEIAEFNLCDNGEDEYVKNLFLVK